MTKLHDSLERDVLQFESPEEPSVLSVRMSQVAEEQKFGSRFTFDTRL